MGFYIIGGIAFRFVDALLERRGGAGSMFMAMLLAEAGLYVSSNKGGRGSWWCFTVGAT